MENATSYTLNDAAQTTSASMWLSGAVRKMFYLVLPDEIAFDETDPMPAYILTTGIPMFFLMIVLEYICQQLLNIHTRNQQAAAREAAGEAPLKSPYSFRINELLNCVGVGAAQQLFSFTFDVIGIVSDVMAYSLAYSYLRVGTVPVKDYPICTYATLMLLKDCAYYWNHRILHEYHTLWASHSVHHSGEDYNLSTGLRQGAIQHILSIPFVLPMALLGFPPQAYAAHAQLNTMYQFWVHTDLINRLPFGLEYLMNSPSAHRMHHRPPGNCNYAGVFIIWDRMFGTYVPEKVRQDYYGLAQQPNTFDPVKLNLQHYQKIMKLKKEPRVYTILGVTFRFPRWTKVMARRVKWNPVFKPLALFTTIPAPTTDIRSQGPVREKWKGTKRNSTSSFGDITKPVGYGVRAISHTTIIIACVILLVTGRALHWGDAALAGVCGLVLLSCVGRMWDNHPGEAEKCLAITSSVLPVMLFAMAVQPFSRLSLAGIRSADLYDAGAEGWDHTCNQIAEFGDRFA